MLNPGYLRTLQEVIRRGSFALAAGYLGYTPSAVSQQMAALERETGVMLFERSARRVRPTPAAHVVAARGGVILAQIEQLHEDLARGQGESADVLRIGAFPTAAENLLPEVFDGWDKTFGVEVTVGEPTLLETALTAAVSIDVALVYHFFRSPESWPNGTDAFFLFDDMMCAVLPAGHALAARANVTLVDLAQYPWIAHPAGTTGARSVERFCRDVGVAPQIVAQSNEYPAMLGLISAGLGVALMPTMAAPHDRAEFAVRDLVGVRCGREVFALVREDETSLLAAAFIERLQRARRDRSA